MVEWALMELKPNGFLKLFAISTTLLLLEWHGWQRDSTGTLSITRVRWFSKVAVFAVVSSLPTDSTSPRSPSWLNHPWANLRSHPVNASPSIHAALKHVSVEGMGPAFANILKRSSSSASLQKSPVRRALSKATRGGTFPRRRGGAAYQQPQPTSLVGQPELLAAELGIGVDSPDEIDLTSLNEENNTVKTTEVAIQTEYEEPIIRAPTPPPVPIRIHPPTSEMAVQVDSEPKLGPLTVNSEVQTLPEVLPMLSDAAIQWSPAPLSVKDTGIQTMHATRSEMETQTPRLLTIEVETQTPKLPSLPLDSIHSSVSPIPRSFRRTITLSNASRSTVTPRSLPGALYREDSGEATITYDRHLYWTDDKDENDGNETETGVETETDADDYQDARASIGVATPASFNDPDEYINTRNTLNLVTPLSQVASASQDDFHSIMTITGNDYSSILALCGSVPDLGTTIASVVLTRDAYGSFPHQVPVPGFKPLPHIPRTRFPASRQTLKRQFS